MTIGTGFLFAVALAGCGLVAGRLPDFGFRLRFIQLLRSFLQRQTGGGAVHRLAGKFRQVDVDIRRDDHQIGRSHFFWRDRIAGAN